MSINRWTYFLKLYVDFKKLSLNKRRKMRLQVATLLRLEDMLSEVSHRDG